MGIRDWFRNRLRRNGATATGIGVSAAAARPESATEPDWSADLSPGLLPADGCTERVQAALRGARQMARSAGVAEIGSEQILLALLQAGDSVAKHLLRSQGIDLVRLKEKARGAAMAHGPVGHGPAAHGTPANGHPVAPGTASRRILERSCRIASEFGQRHVGTEHLLLALCSHEGNGSFAVLRGAGVDPVLLRKEWIEQLDAGSDAEGPDREVLAILEEIRSSVRKLSTGQTPTDVAPPPAKGM